MQENIDSTINTRTEVDQKQGGTLKVHLTQLQKQFRELIAAGASNVDNYEKAMTLLLQGFEGIRVSTEAQITDHETKIAYLRAKQKACTEHANLLLSIMAVQVQEARAAKRREDDGGNGVSQPKDSIEPITDKEMLNTICICGCQDEIDAVGCKCKCHTNGVCDDEECKVCPVKKVAIKALETSGRKKSPPAKPKRSRAKKASKKKPVCRPRKKAE
jgi:hypothetical protein